MTKKRGNSPETEIVMTLFKVIGMIVLLPFQLFKKPGGAGSKYHSGASVDRQKISEQWHQIKNLMQLSGASHFRMAILQADTVFDSALKSMGMAGNTMGERLQSAEHLFTRDTYHLVWQAHKVRNRLAHEIDTEVMSWEAGEAIASFEQGLRELRVLDDRIGPL